MFKNVLLELLGRPLVIDRNFNQVNTSNTDEPKKRRKSNNCEGSNDDWEFLLSKILPENCDKRTIDEQNLRNNSNAVLFPKIPLVFYTLHLFYEDMKIDSMMKLHLNSLAEVSLKWWGYVSENHLDLIIFKTIVKKNQTFKYLKKLEICIRSIQFVLYIELGTRLGLYCAIVSCAH